MTGLYKKNELNFAVMWIVAYVVLSSMADLLSEKIGIEKSVTAALHIIMSLILFFWIRKNDMREKYGFCRPVVPAKKFLYYVPLAIIASSSLWGGISLEKGVTGTFMYVISMCCVGFIEEVIFRGLLFRALEKNGLKQAIIISSLTFGIGHIVNLFNGSGKDIASSMIQITFAVLVGFVLVLIFCYGKSLIPCIVFHSVNNALGAFEAEGSIDAGTEMILNLVLIFVVLGGYVIYLLKTFHGKSE